MIGFFVSVLLSLLAWGPARLLRAARRRALSRRGVVALALDTRPSAQDLAAVLDELDALAAEGMARAVLLRLGATPLGWAGAGALRETLERVRAAGRLVVVQLDEVSNGSLLVASAADRVWLAPSADAMLSGVGADLSFYGDALERVGLRAEVVSAGAYKSAGEPFSRAFPSPESREAMSALVSDLQEQLVETLAAGRRVSVETVRSWMARAPLSPEEARAEGMVDDLAYEDQVEAELGILLGAEPRWTSLSRFARWRRAQRWLERLGRRRPLVAVLHLEGQVVATEDANSSGEQIDAERVVPALAGLLESPRVAAVVLHIQSPGGSAQASDDIARGVERLARVKPVVAVFGDVAASGGYYIAAPAAEIIASPGSITGSIGVVGGKLVVGGAAARLGVYTERVSAGPDGALLSPWQAFSPEQRDRFQASLARFYRRFLAVVAAGRKLPVRAVEPAAQGRVWTGRQALGLGLVDRLGGLALGVERAASRAGLRVGRYEVAHLGFQVSRVSALVRTVRRLATAPTLPAAVELPAALLAAAGPAMELPRALARTPGRALALLPWRIDGAS